MKLLKIGMLNYPQKRWLDGLNVFEKITIFKYKNIEPRVDSFDYFEINENGFIFLGFRVFITILKKYRWAACLEEIFVACLRFCFRKKLKDIAKCEYDEVHVSCNDFDDSALLFLLIHPYLRKNVRVTRSYKETRPGYNYLERKSFVLSDRICLNAKENLVFFEKKYGKGFFDSKELILGFDEDAISEEYIESIEYMPKLSEKDGKKHAIILAGRVFSDSSDSRSGSRLYYIPMIRDFIKAGIVVHLNTLRVIPDRNGIDQYEILEKQNPGMFCIDQPFDLRGNGWKKSLSMLSSYDYGIMHNYIEGTSNSEFDKYNIPHRYYEYQLAHVIPLLQNGKTILMQRILTEKKTGIIYDEIKEVLQDHIVEFQFPKFVDYIEELYSK